MADEPKRQEPEIMPPAPQEEPERHVPEIPPNENVPEKKGPIAPPPRSRHGASGRSLFPGSSADAVSLQTFDRCGLRD